MSLDLPAQTRARHTAVSQQSQGPKASGTGSSPGLASCAPPEDSSRRKRSHNPDDPQPAKPHPDVDPSSDLFAVLSQLPGVGLERSCCVRSCSGLGRSWATGNDCDCCSTPWTRSRRIWIWTGGHFGDLTTRPRPGEGTPTTPTATRPSSTSPSAGRSRMARRSSWSAYGRCRLLVAAGGQETLVPDRRHPAARGTSAVDAALPDRRHKRQDGASWHETDAADCLLGAASGAQLLVLGRHTGAHHLGGFAFGSTSRKVLHHARVPVAVVPTASVLHEEEAFDEGARSSESVRSRPPPPSHPDTPGRERLRRACWPPCPGRPHRLPPAVAGLGRGTRPDTGHSRGMWCG
jgi:universal stress protein family protein